MTHCRKLPWIGKNIYFLGFMASGKSRIGSAFAHLLGWPFHDTDELIEEYAGKKISEIFEHDGEEAFRHIETQVIENVSNMKNNVIALGGGAVVREQNWQLISNSGITIRLAAPVHVLSERIARNQDRPLMANLSETERIKKIEAMLKTREPYYRRAQFTFESSDDMPVPDFIRHIYATLLERL